MGMSAGLSESVALYTHTLSEDLSKGYSTGSSSIGISSDLTISIFAHSMSCITRQTIKL